jgi:hypothetical protein
MKCARGWAALLVLLGVVAGAPAQGLWPASPGGFAVGFGGHGRHGHVSLLLSGGGYYASPYFFSPAYALPVSRVTVVQVYAPPPIVLGDEGVMPLDLRPRRPPELIEAPERPAEPPLPGAFAGGFRPVRPEERARAQQPVPPAPKPEDRPKAEPPKAKPPDQGAPELPHPPLPEADPQAESARLVALGREAFAAGEHGRAAARFRQATEAAPDEPLPHFLLAQADLALGKYDEAVEAVQNGMRRRPDWPTAAFRPVELYNGHVADWPEHLRRLADARARHPDDPVLLFLEAYELWFDGRRDEARPLFQRAAARAADRSFSERFLLARPNGPAV